MIVLDIVLIATLGIGALSGYKKGLIVEVLSLLSFFVGLYLALRFTLPISGKLFNHGDFYHVSAIVAFILLFILPGIVMRIIGKFIKNIMRIMFLGIMDNILGGLAGLLKWTFILSMVFWIFDAVGVNIVDRYVEHNIILPYILNIGTALFEWVSAVLPFAKDSIKEIENLHGQIETA